MTATTPYPLGRNAVADERDRLYMAADRSPATAPERGHRYLRRGWRGDQNAVRDPDGTVRPKPWCAAYMAMHALEMLGRPGDPDTWDMRWLYHEAQRNDQWEGESYDGTSVRAVLHVLKREGAISGYFWLTTARQVRRYTVDEGRPVLVGSKWTWDMFTPDQNGFLWPTGDTAGGHAYVVNGGNRRRSEHEMTNSWGRWGRAGRAKLTDAVLDELIQDGGEACVVELPA